MFDPEVEARFKRIEDAQVVTAELLHRSEMKSQERMERFEAIQDALARWIDKMQGWQDKMGAWQDEMQEWRKDAEFRMNAMTDAITELSRTVNTFLKARSNGGGS